MLEPSAELRVMSNSLILDNITSYLTPSQLKVTRQVNHLWKERSDKFLFKKGQFSLLAPEPNKTIRYWSGKLHSEVKHVTKFEHLRMDNVTYLEDEGMDTLLNGERRRCQYQELAASFVAKYGANVKHLKIRVRLHTTENYIFLVKVLSSLQNLQTVNLNLWGMPKSVKVDDEEITPAVVLLRFLEGVPKLTLFSVKSLKLKLTTPDHREMCTPTVDKFVSTIPRFFPNLEIFRSHYNYENVEEHHTAFLVIVSLYLYGRTHRRLADVKNPNASYFPAFEHLVEIDTFVSDTRLFSMLARLMTSLKRLRVKDFTTDGENPHSFYAAIERHAGTLEELEIREVMHGVEDKVFVPVCPKLKILDVTSSYRGVIGPAIGGKEYDLLSLAPIFSAGPATFRKHFPALTTLRLVYSEMFSQEIYHNFFPPEAKFQFPGITELRVSFPEDMLSDSYQNWGKRLVALFPSVNLRGNQRLRVKK